MDPSAERCINKWLIFYWTKGYHPEEIIHPDDLPGVSAVGMAYCEGTEGDYLVLRDGARKIRARARGKIIVLPPSKFFWNDPAREVARPEMAGIIGRITWHEKDQEFKYFITVNGKLKSRRYDPDELEPL